MTANEALDIYLNSLEPKERASKSRDIRTLCKKSRSVLYDWSKGITKIEAIFRDKISEAIRENIFETITN